MPMALLPLKPPPPPRRAGGLLGAVLASWTRRSRQPQTGGGGLPVRRPDVLGTSRAALPQGLRGGALPPLPAAGGPRRPWLWSHRRGLSLHFHVASPPCVFTLPVSCGDTCHWTEGLPGAFRGSHLETLNYSFKDPHCK